jgi:hypothetical protein
MPITKFKSKILWLERKFNTPNLYLELKNSLKNNKSFTLSCSDQSLFVIKPMLIDSVGTLFVWVGISKNKSSTLDCIKRTEEIAKELDCKAVRFESKRKGFKRYAPLFGYHYIGDRDKFNIYEKRL